MLELGILVLVVVGACWLVGGVLKLTLGFLGALFGGLFGLLFGGLFCLLVLPVVFFLLLPLLMPALCVAAVVWLIVHASRPTNPAATTR